MNTLHNTNAAVNQLFANQQQQQQQQYPAETANFNLIAATNKNSERAPDFFGSTKIGSTWYMFSAWLIFSRSGKQMINTSMRPATAQEAARQEQQAAQYDQNRNQGHNQGYAQNPLQGATGSPSHAAHQAAVQPSTGAFNPHGQSPYQLTNMPQNAPQSVQHAQFAQAPWENQLEQQTVQQQSAQQTSNPLEEEVQVVHVDLPTTPNF